MDPAAPTPRERLAAAGLRTTVQRVAVLQAIERREHLDADQIRDRVTGQIGKVSTQAVYDVLKALSEAGLLRKIQPAGSSALYELRVADNHHHLICRSCRKILDVDCAHGAAPCIEPDDDHGFVLDEAEVIYWGLCADGAHVSSALPQN